MWGVRCLHNFGKVGGPSEPVEDSEKSTAAPTKTRSGVKRIDEEDAMEGGLKGRISAGAEFYFSAKEKSAGGRPGLVHCAPSCLISVYLVSTGIRFTTLPDATPPSFQLPSSSPTQPSLLAHGAPSQPPTTITALFNPMLGHMSGAYSARVSRDLSMSSRFDFNVYSYESEWSIGAEWWTRRGRGMFTSNPPAADTSEKTPSSPPALEAVGDVTGVVKARASTTTVSSAMSRDSSQCLILDILRISH